MAFPRVLSQRSQVAATGAATALTLPSGIMAGDLLLCFAISRVTTTAITVSVGTWTTVLTDSSTTYSAIFARIADGTAADKITLNKANDDWCAVILRIGDHGVTNIATDILKATSAGATSSTPDPPSLTAASAADYLWFAMAGGQIVTTTGTITGQPTNYIQDIATKSASSTTSVSLAVAHRAINGTTENPGTFTTNTSRAWRAQTIAIKPGTARSGARIDECPLPVGVSGNVGTSASFTPPANSVLIAMCGIGNSSGAGSQTGALTDSLSSSWTKLDEYTPASGDGLVQIWGLDIGASPAARTVTITGTSALGQGVTLTLFALFGVKPVASILGTVRHAALNAISDTINVSTAGSLILAMFCDANGAATATPGTNMMMDLAFNDATYGEKQAAIHAKDVQPAGNFTYSIAGVTANQASFAAWELLSSTVPPSALANQYWGVKV